ncbi:hypothetical protein PV328_004038 [Microctonus aethiopoides]|uniref:Uncharacterized protein n=1 Tax=Microctonus aethiopoides TaxID=144406 RepID=A0AA39F9S1_9HYME|nr:hypothetical protein PV328_004038 [Microctonus aethiopoides]
MSNAESNRQYRTLVPTAPLTQLSPDAGPTIIQHEAVTVYNSVNKKVRDVIDFLHEALLAYTKGGLKLLKKRYHELPLILGGVFWVADYEQDLRFTIQDGRVNLQKLTTISVLPIVYYALMIKIC